MTIEEFNKIPFTGNMIAAHKGKTFPIASCDFEEKTIGIIIGKILIWISYKNIKIIKQSM